MKKLFALAAFCAVLCANSGCETLQRHPVAVSVAAGLIAGSIALSARSYTGHTELPFARTCEQYYLNQGLTQAAAQFSCR